MEKSLSQLWADCLEHFRDFPLEVRKACIEVARNKSPSAVGVEVYRIVDRFGVDKKRDIALVKGTRFLAIIRCDHGVDAFEAFAQELTAKENLPVTVWKLASGEEVVDREESHLHGDVASLLSEVFAHVHKDGQHFIEFCHDFGRTVGVTTCVRTNPGDEIVYAQRIGRKERTRFVKNRRPEPCSKVTVILRLRDDGRYEIVTAYIGPKAEREPWDLGARQTKMSLEASLQFWENHALVWGTEEIIPGTETSWCPW